MKTTLRNIFSFLFAISLAAGVSARANDSTDGTDPNIPNEPLIPIIDPGPGDGGGGSGGHHHEGDFHGFMLQPTADAPAGSGGWAVICTNTTPPSLHIATVGLTAGAYTVNVTSKADGSVTSFGTLNVQIPVDIPPMLLHESDAVDAIAEFLAHFISEQSLDFPDGYDPANVASVQVVDANTVTMLSGDNAAPVTKPGGGDHEHQQFVLQPTADGPADATGHAHVSVEHEDGVITSAALKIETRGLAEGTYTANVVSIADGTVTALGTFDVAAPADGETSESEASIPFPDGANPADVGTVQVADVNGVILLTGDGTVRGGHDGGNEYLHERITLQASANAPVVSAGSAEIEARNRNGVKKAVLEIKTSGLDVGTYTASVTSVSDGTVTVLGTFDVAGTNAQDDGNVEFDNENRAGLAFPDGFNPLDVGGLQIADANGVVMLTGDFSNVTASTATTLTVKVNVTPGAAAPNASGVAAASSKVSRHKLRQTFTLVAKHVPANKTLTMKVNGNTVGTVKTSRRGNVSVPRLSRSVKVHKITSVTLQDKSGNTVLSAHF